MKQTVYFNDFKNAFHAYGRGDQFSYEGLRALYDLITELEESTGEDVELDVIAVCCDFTEYADLEEVKNSYSSIESLEDLENYTMVRVFDGGLIVANF